MTDNGQINTPFGNVPIIQQQDGADPEQILMAFCNEVRTRERARGCLCKPLAMNVKYDPKDHGYLVVTDHNPECLRYMASRDNRHLN
jgi:hypothetical protein